MKINNLSHKNPNYLQAPQPKKVRRNKKKSIVATSTPELKKIQDAIEEKERKKLRKGAKRKVLHDESSSEEENIALDSESDDSITEGPVIKEVTVENLSIGTYVLVEYQMAKSIKFYVGSIISIAGEYYEVDFLRPSQKMTNKFVKPINRDIDQVTFGQIKAVLPEPYSKGTTARTKCGVVFPMNFGNINFGVWTFQD